MDYLNIAFEAVLLVIVAMLGYKIYQLDMELGALYRLFYGHSHELPDDLEDDGK